MSNVDISPTIGLSEQYNSFNTNFSNNPLIIVVLTIMIIVFVLGAGTLGPAIGTAGAIVEDAELLQMYEVFYSYPVNDSMTITPAFFVKELAGSGDDESGLLVKTSFSF